MKITTSTGMILDDDTLTTKIIKQHLEEKDMGDIKVFHVEHYNVLLLVNKDNEPIFEGTLEEVASHIDMMYLSNQIEKDK